MFIESNSGGLLVHQYYDYSSCEQFKTIVMPRRNGLIKFEISARLDFKWNNIS